VPLLAALPSLLLRLLLAAVLQGCRHLPHVEELVVDAHEQQADKEGGEDRDEYPVPVPPRESICILLAQRPESDQEDVLNQHDGVEGDDLQLGALLLQVDVAEDVDVGDKDAQPDLLPPGQFLSLEGGIAREDPEHHGDPVQGDHKEDPVRVDGGVEDEDEHPAGDRAQPPDELEDDSEPGEDEAVHVVLPDVLRERGERPANVEEAQGHRDHVDLLHQVGVGARDVKLDEQESHGLCEAVDHPEDAEVPHLLLDVLQLDGGKEQAVPPHHATTQPVHHGEKSQAAATHVAVTFLNKHPSCGEELAGDQGEDD